MARLWTRGAHVWHNLNILIATGAVTAALLIVGGLGNGDPVTWGLGAGLGLYTLNAYKRREAQRMSNVNSGQPQQPQQPQRPTQDAYVERVRAELEAVRQQLADSEGVRQNLYVELERAKAELRVIGQSHGVWEARSAGAKGEADELRAQLHTLQGEMAELKRQHAAEVNALKHEIISVKVNSYREFLERTMDATPLPTRPDCDDEDID